ncbi:MAG: hypothetical protein WCV55_01990 [Candidatus Paceibacterota bacterium]
MMIKFTKPSKKIVALLIIVVSIIAGILILKYKQNIKAFIPPSLTYSVTDINTYNREQSTDSQYLNNLLGIENASSTNATDTANTSDLVSRSLYAGYLALSQSGDTSADSQQSLAKEIASKAAQSFTYETYSAENLKFISTPTKENVKFFASSLASIQNNILMGMAKESVDQNNVKLKNIAQIYRDAAKNVYDLLIPIDIAESTLGIVNNYSIVASVYDALAVADSDPVQATIAIGYLQQANSSQTKYVNNLANYFKYSGIIFTSDEVGRYWNDFGSAGMTGNSTQ